MNTRSRVHRQIGGIRPHLRSFPPPQPSPPTFHPTSPPSRGKATDGHPSKTQAFKIKRVSNRSPSSTAPCEAPIPNHKWKGGCLEIDAPKTCHRPPVSPTRAPPTHLCNSGEHGISCPTTISPHKASTDKNISKTHWFLRNWWPLNPPKNLVLRQFEHEISCSVTNLCLWGHRKCPTKRTRNWKKGVAAV